MNIKQLNQEIREFCEEREWTQFHTPKDLAIGISTEANELLEIFRFKDESKQEKMLQEEESRTEIEEELADVIFFILRFADLYDIDVENALKDKLEKNRNKYPKSKLDSINDEYTE